MKTLNFRLPKMFMLAAFASLTILSACKKNDAVAQNQGIVGVVNSSPDFTLLRSALVHADLISVLDGAGPFTVFAPNNAAFAASGLDTEAKIRAIEPAALRQILMYHVLASRVQSSAIQVGNNTAVNTAANVNVFVTKNNNGVYVNGAMVINADVMASNGVIHVINKVIMPPSGNIVQVAQSNPNFSFLVAAVLRASQGSTNVAQVLSGNGPFTVFAPTNQAFIKAGFATEAAIQAADPAVLTNILTYHVIAGRVLSSDLTEGAQPATVQTGTLNITLAGGAKVKGAGNANPSNITQTDLITTNGVIHVIDQVLLPRS